MSQQDKQQLLDAVEGGTGPWIQLMCRRLLCVCYKGCEGDAFFTYFFFFTYSFPTFVFLTALPQATVAE